MVIKMQITIYQQNYKKKISRFEDQIKSISQCIFAENVMFFINKKDGFNVVFSVGEYRSE